ncbi:MAG TPA: hypothetical protein EYP58_00365 [bacterium (Candidatus Stahlbacteria)]|nr:hypothetical protein [Candidatus Stahlbacteria bacterium]
MLVIILIIFGNFTHPLITPYGVVVSNSNCSQIYLIEDGNLELLISAPGAGRYYTLSPDQRYLGIKLIGADGLQAPAVLDLKEKTITKLTRPCLRVGQVSFSKKGDVVYTLDEQLIVRDEDGEQRYRLDTYANITPISPDGRYVVYNDFDDRLWLLDLRSGRRRCFTGKGYFRPIWSPDGLRIVYSRLDGSIEVYDRDREKTYKIGRGFGPAWLSDGEHIVYYLIETDGHELKGSDLYLARFDGLKKLRLTRTGDIFEMDPSVGPDGQIIFQAHAQAELRVGRLVDNCLDDVRVVFKSDDPVESGFYQINDSFDDRDSIDVPYLHQVYDVPDWFNGHWACAPTTAMMVIAHYNRLPYWDCLCSSPYQHISHYGRYICERYFYREENYNLQAQDPSGNWAMGGYGYMWAGSNHPYTHMAPYINNHNITSWRDDGPPFSLVVNELNQGYPYGLCVGLTAAGHLVLTVGQVLDWHTLIFNDPYGNKNTPGYPSYDGKYARYDWPGYNNGYENLNNVYWGVGARGDWEVPTDTIVDDLQFNDGFYLHTDAPSTMAFWWDALIGYNGHIWWTYTTHATSEDTCYATWTPVLSAAGNYEVFAYIPNDHAAATGARYRIYYAGGNQTVVVDQSQHPGEWVSLGTFPFDLTGGYVYLGDATGTQGRHIGYDAIRWSYRGPGVVEEAATLKPGVRLQSTIIRTRLNLEINLSNGGDVVCRIYGVDGRLYDDLYQVFNPGTHSLVIGTAGLPAGIYILKTEIEGRAYLDKFIVAE